MRLGIKYKLFFILLSASLLIIIGMFVFTRMSFERGFIHYMDKIHENNMIMMSQEIADLYSRYEGWNNFRENPEVWDSVQAYTFRKWRNERRDSKFHRPHRRMDSSGTPQKTPDHRRGHKPRYCLLDQNRQPVFSIEGARIPKRLYPVLLDGNTVGYVGVIHPRNLIQEEELRFFKRQGRIFLFIALGMVGLSIIVAVWTAIYLERPIRTVTQGTRELSSGHYKTRIPVKSRDELGLLAEDFNALARTLEENEKDRKKWVEDIAHELRTPLTLLSGELEAVDDGVRDLTPETISRLRGDIQHLINLVSDLNELSRTDKGALTYKMENVNLSHLLEDVLGRYEEAMNDHGLKVDVSTAAGKLTRLSADPERLKQLFVNIFENILKYTRKGDRVNVGLERLKEDVLITVEDSGPGVPEESLSRLFERLYRVEGSRNRRFGGSGLGLAISKNIVEAHKGTITAFSSGLGGLGIRIQLPLKPGPMGDTSVS